MAVALMVTKRRETERDWIEVSEESDIMLYPTTVYFRRNRKPIYDIVPEGKLEPESRCLINNVATTHKEMQ